MRFVLTIYIVLVGMVPNFAYAQVPSAPATTQQNRWSRDRRVFTDPEQSKIKDFVDVLLREDERAPADSGQIDQSSNAGAKADN